MIIYDPEITGSFRINGQPVSSLSSIDSISGSVAVLENKTLVSSSNQLAGQTIDGDLTVTGKLTAQEYHTELVSASIIYESGSTQFGDSIDDVHDFTGSLQVSGSTHYLLGNVGIGTSSPYNALTIEGSTSRLDLNNGGGASRKALLIEPLGYGGNAYARIESYDYGASSGGNLAINATGGNVGIGTTSPASKLTLYSINRTDDIRMLATNGGTTNSYIGNFAGDTYLATNYYFDGSQSSDDATKSSMEIFLGQSNFELNYMAAGAPGTRQKRLVVDSSGNVGIGTTNPSAFNSLAGKHLVIGDGTQTNTLTLYSSAAASAAGYGHVAFADSNTSSSTAQYAGLIQYYHGNDSMTFYTSSTPRMIIDSSGTTTLSKNQGGGGGINLSIKGTNGVGGGGRTFGLDFQGISNDTGPAYSQFARILTGKTNGIQGDSKGDLYFDTNGGAGLVNAMVINSSGNVGIGTTSPANPVGFIKVLNVSGPDSALVISNTSGTAKNWTIGALDSGTLYIADASAARMVINSSGNIGIGTASPGAKLSVNGQTEITGNLFLYAGGVGSSFNRQLYLGSGTEYNYQVKANGDDFQIIEAGSHVFFEYDYGGSLGSGTIRLNNNTVITGSISKSSGSFKIPHPLPEKKDTHHLVHSFVEAPQADNIYRGKVQLSEGKAIVNLDQAGRMTEGTFVLLNGNIQCFTSNESGWTAIRGKVDGNILTIEAQDTECTDTVSWLVIGERIDQHMIDTEWTDENGRVITEPLKDNN